MLSQPSPVVDPVVATTAEPLRSTEMHPRAVEKLGSSVARRRRWALHRHVHLVAAFDHARAIAPVRTFLGAGCGAGLSELYLAATNPDVQFTLADFDEERIERAREVGDAYQIENVTYRTLDLLNEPTGERYDFVSSIEVLEHIDDDRTAARNLLAHSQAFTYVLVPHCSEAELVDPVMCERVWRNNEHHRPGYTQRTFAELLDGTDTLFARNCYFMPTGGEFRRSLEAVDTDELARSWRSLMATAADDIEDRYVENGMRGALGIEALVRVRTVAAGADDQPQIVHTVTRPGAAPSPPARRSNPVRRLRDRVVETRAAIVTVRS